MLSCNTPLWGVTSNPPLCGWYLICDEPPSEGVVRLTPGYSRDHRPDLNQVMLELIVEHQAGIPLLMNPSSG
jgi:hypothetical protein